MKAVILCGGFGKRLLPLTENTPKSLLPVKGKPILEYLLKKIEPLEGIDQVFISTNEKFEQQFADFLQHYQSSKLIKQVVEPSQNEEHKFGAVRGIEYVMDEEKITEPLLVLNGDNLFDAGLFGLMLMYKKQKSPVIGVYDVQSPELAKNYGIVAVDDKNRITQFEEKPAQPPSTLASTGIYAFTLPALQRIPQYLKSNGGDRPGDFIKWLTAQEKVYAFTFQGKWYDIGSQAEYTRANQEWE